MARAAQELTIPFIASGGIADGRGFAAALALGAAVSCVCAGAGDLANDISGAARRALTWVRAKAWGKVICLLTLGLSRHAVYVYSRKAGSV